MKFEYKINGITLDEFDMQRIKEYYEVACTAEYIMDNYDIINQDEAMKLGYDVRKFMDKYGCDEIEAIEQVLRRD